MQLFNYFKYTQKISKAVLFASRARLRMIKMQSKHLGNLWGDISGLLGLHLEHLMQQRCLFLLLRPKAKGICSGGATPTSKSVGWFLVKILHFCNHVSRTCVLLKTLKAFQILSERPNTSKIFIAVWRHRVLHTWTFKHPVSFFNMLF